MPDLCFYSVVLDSEVYSALAPLSELRSCVKVEVAALGSPSLTSLSNTELEENVSELRSCVRVEVAVLGSRPD